MTEDSIEKEKSLQKQVDSEMGIMAGLGILCVWLIAVSVLTVPSTATDGINEEWWRGTKELKADKHTWKVGRCVGELYRSKSEITVKLRL